MLGEKEELGEWMFEREGRAGWVGGWKGRTHIHGGAILHTPTGIEVLGLGQNATAGDLAQTLEFDQWGVAYDERGG